MSYLLMVISSNTFFSCSARQVGAGDLLESLITTNKRLEDQAIAR
ncbi:unnamed protein product [Musa banksii]